MLPRRPTAESDDSRPRTALPHLLALAMTLLVVVGGTVAVTPVAASAAVQDDAQSVEFGQEYEASLSADDTTQSYTFRAEAGEYIRLGTYAGVPDAIDATIYGPSGQELNSYDVYVEWLLLGARAPETGEYRVEFSGGESYAGENASLDYSFRVDTVAPDSYESNDGMASASSLEESTTVDAELGQNEDDWYAVEAAEGSGIVADLDRDRNYLTNSYRVEIVDESGEVLAETESRCSPGAGPCNPQGVSTNVPDDGTYYVHVAPGVDGINGFDAYSMWVDFESPDDPPAQVDDGDPKEATPGTEYGDSVAQNDTTDVYTFDAEAGEYVRVSARAGAPDRVDATVYGPSGDELDSDDVYVDQTLLGGEAPESGEYRVEFEFAGSGPPAQEYDFRLDVARPDDHESNDETGSATDFTGSETVDAVLGQGDDDFYAVSAAGGSTLAADVDRESNNVGNGYEVRLLDGDGEVLDETSVGCGPANPCDPSAVSATVPDDGEYYVHVSGAATGFDAYSLSVDAEQPADETETPDDAPDSDDTGDGDSGDENTDDGDGSDDSEDTDDDSSNDADGDDTETESPDDGDAADDSTSSDGADDSTNDDAGSDDSTDPGTDDGDSDAETTAPDESGDSALNNEGSTVTETTDSTAEGDDAAAGPSVPVNNTSETATAIVQGDAGTETESSSGFGPGFGVVAMLLALLGAALLARRGR